ncbi:MAG TPA: hypothetical protein VF042_08275 [Gemmatimonadaceae bacterium]
MRRLSVLIALFLSGCSGDHPSEPRELPLRSIRIIAPSFMLLSSGPVLIDVVLRDSQNQVVKRPFTIRSSDEKVVTVDPGGVATPVAAGIATIVVSSDGLTERTSLEVRVPELPPCNPNWEDC